MTRLVLAPIPKAGEVYLQLGIRLVVVDVTPRSVVFCCRSDTFTGPPRQVSLSVFLQQIETGVLEREPIAVERAEAPS